MLGFGFLCCGLSSKTADSESTSVHSFTLSLPPSSRRHNRKLPGNPSKTWTGFDPSSRPHSHAHIQTHIPKQISHTFSYKKQCTFHNMDSCAYEHAEETNLFRRNIRVHLPPPNHITQSLTLQNDMISI